MSFYLLKYTLANDSYWAGRIYYHKEALFSTKEKAKAKLEEIKERYHPHKCDRWYHNSEIITVALDEENED